MVPEVGEAISEMWRAIGLDPKIFNMAYTAHRPRLVDRTLNYPWLFVNAGVDDPITEPRGPLWQTVESGASPGFEIPFHWDLAQRIQAEEDPVVRAPLNIEAIDWMNENVWLTGVVAVPQLFTYNPKKIADWPLNREFPINNLENITKAQ